MDGESRFPVRRRVNHAAKAVFHQFRARLRDIRHVKTERRVVCRHRGVSATVRRKLTVLRHIIATDKNAPSGVLPSRLHVPGLLPFASVADGPRCGDGRRLRPDAIHSRSRGLRRARVTAIEPLFILTCQKHG